MKNDHAGNCGGGAGAGAEDIQKMKIKERRRSGPRRNMEVTVGIICCVERDFVMDIAGGHRNVFLRGAFGITICIGD